MRVNIRFVGVGAACAVACAASASPVGIYQSNGTFESSIAGAPDLDVVGIGGLGFSTSLVDGVNTGTWSWQAGTGLRADTASILSGSQWSVGIAFAHDGVSGFRKILDTRDRVSDRGWYNYSGTDALGFFSSDSGSEALGPGVFADVVITFDGATGRGFVDGSLSAASSQSEAALSAEALMHFFIDDAATGFRETGSGSVASIVIWDRALSASEVADLGALVSIPAPSVVSILSIGGLVAARRRRGRADRA